jgi:hypothetical protein
VATTYYYYSSTPTSSQSPQWKLEITMMAHRSSFLLPSFLPLSTPPPPQLATSALRLTILSALLRWEYLLDLLASSSLF